MKRNRNALRYQRVQKFKSNLNVIGLNLTCKSLGLYHCKWQRYTVTSIFCTEWTIDGFISRVSKYTSNVMAYNWSSRQRCDILLRSLVAIDCESQIP